MIGWLLLGLFACGDGLPDRIEDCPDEACRLSWVLDAYGRDPDRAVAAIDTIADPVERVVVVTRVVETWPGRTRELCSKLTSGPPRTRCERINGRPHLQTDPPDRKTTARAAGGPSSAALPTPNPASSPYYGVKTGPGPCQQRREPHVCYATQAMREALADPGKAAAACAGIEEQKWSSECLFSAAEMLVNARGVEGIAGASDLCIAAVPFSANCLAHVLVMLAKTTPDATEARPDQWAPLVPVAEALAAYWSARSPENADLFVDRFWSETMSLAYADTPQVTGGPIDALPARVMPHVRAAAAYRLMELDGLGAREGLAAWTDALEAALALRADEAHQKPRPTDPRPPPRGPERGRPEADDTVLARSGAALFQGKLNFWDEDRPGDEALPAIFYWGTARRTYSADARTDLGICVLEAAAQHANLAAKKGDRAAVERARALLVEGAASADPATRWTAERLLAAALP